VLNILMFTVAGATGLGFLVRMLRRVFAPPLPAPGAMGPPTAAQVMNRGRTVFRVWLVIYSIVGAQMGWILRPFIGNPDLDFELFRDRYSNFFAEVPRLLGQLFG